jgi:FlaA1/EpsC-like NDP-sugar epimerase
MTKIRLLVVGAGGHGRSVAEAAELSGQFEVVGLLDDSLTAAESVLGVPVLVPAVRMAHHRQIKRQEVEQFKGMRNSVRYLKRSSNQLIKSLKGLRAA